MKLSHLQALIAVTDIGSIRAAAAALGRTQSALTKQIRQIEDDTGLSLFVRTSRGVVPTEAGLSLLSRARSIVAEAALLDEEVSRLRGHKSGAVRVSAAPMAAVKILPSAIARFNLTHRDVDITISSDMFGDALTALREGRHDLIIGPHGHTPEARDLQREELISTEIVVITSARAAHAKATSLADLTDCYWAMMGDTTGAPKRRFQEQFSQHGLVPPNIRLASESRLGLLALVQELDAVCTFPARLLDELGPDSGVARIPIRERLKPLTIAMVSRAGKPLTPVGEHLAECIRHRAAELRRAWG